MRCKIQFRDSRQFTFEIFCYFINFLSLLLFFTKKINYKPIWIIKIFLLIYWENKLTNKFSTYLKGKFAYWRDNWHSNKLNVLSRNREWLIGSISDACLCLSLPSLTHTPSPLHNKKNKVISVDENFPTNFQSHLSNFIL